MAKQIDVEKRFDRLMGQFNRAIKASGIVKYGVSKKASVANAVNQLRADGVSATKHNIALKTPVHNSGTYDNFYSKVRMLCDYVSRNHQNIKNIDEISRKPVEGFLRNAASQNVKLETYQNYKSDLTKVQQVLEHHYSDKGIDKNADFIDKAKGFVDSTKEVSELERGVDGRAYNDPRVIVDSIEREDHRLVASIQLEAGARVNEASLIDEQRLGGITEHMGRDVGVIHLQDGDAKGGLERDLYLPRDTYEKLELYVQEHGKLHVPDGYDRDVYRAAIKEAAEENGQKYTGSHGLRHNYAQARMEELKAEGVGESAAKTAISVEMGHFREDITDHYLRR